MAARTVRDCDRCGKPDIRETPISRFLCSGTRLDVDVCTECRLAMFNGLVNGLDESDFCGFVGEMKTHRESTAKHHGATPYDLRP